MLMNLSCKLRKLKFYMYRCLISHSGSVRHPSAVSTDETRTSKTKCDTFHFDNLPQPPPPQSSFAAAEVLGRRHSPFASGGGVSESAGKTSLSGSHRVVLFRCLAHSRHIRERSRPKTALRGRRVHFINRRPKSSCRLGKCHASWRQSAVFTAAIDGHWPGTGQFGQAGHSSVSRYWSVLAGT